MTRNAVFGVMRTQTSLIRYYIPTFSDVESIWMVLCTLAVIKLDFGQYWSCLNLTDPYLNRRDFSGASAIVVLKLRDNNNNELLPAIDLPTAATNFKNGLNQI